MCCASASSLFFVTTTLSIRHLVSVGDLSKYKRGNLRLVRICQYIITAGVSCVAFVALFARLSVSSVFSGCAVCAVFSGSTVCAGVAFVALFALNALCAGLTLVTFRACVTCVTFVAFFALDALRAGVAFIAFQTCQPFGLRAVVAVLLCNRLGGQIIPL